MNQPKDASDHIKNAGLHHPQTSIPQTQYRSGFPVETIPTADMSQARTVITSSNAEIVSALGHHRKAVW